MPRVACDVTVIGAGPAGCLCALFLVRSGLRVRLLACPSARPRPAEVLAPAALRALRSAGIELSEFGLDALTCNRVGSQWASGPSYYFDYQLYACEAALNVDRIRLDSALCGQARTAGAEVVNGTAKHVIRKVGGGWSVHAACDSIATYWDTRFVVDATGKSAANPVAQERTYVDRLIALHSRCQVRENDGTLLLEAAPDGWWYVSNCPNGLAHVVFVTDADVLPKSRLERAAWLQAQFRHSVFVSRSLVGTPAFARHRGCDARSSHNATFAVQGFLSVGDAAWSNDPLSGSGVLLAAEGAARAAKAIQASLIAHDESPLSEYAAWCRNKFTTMQTSRSAVYRQAAPGPWHSAFWARRGVGGAPRPGPMRLQSLDGPHADA